MKCYVILNGEKLNNFQIEENSFIIATDGGYEFCKERNLKVDLVVGDFDSLGYAPAGSKIFPVEKDLTDGEIALNEAEKLGYKKVEFLCGGGGREDHLICNLKLLEIANKMGVFATLTTNYSKIFYVENNFEIKVEKNSFVSILPVYESLIKNSVGLKYEYNNTKISRASTLGISNVAIGEEISLNLAYGGVYIFINYEKIA